MEEKGFVTQRVAKLLRLKKFDLITTQYYFDGDNVLRKSFSTVNWNDVKECYSAPTVQVARDWVEEKYGFFIEIGRSIDLNGTYHYDYMVLDKTCKCVCSPTTDFISYYEAANKGLEYVLENLIRETGK